MRKFGYMTLCFLIVSCRANESLFEKMHKVPVASIEMGNDDYSDLLPLKESIGQKRIVILSEGNHTHGSSIQGINRVTKFLHEEMGFDVILSEAGIRMVERAQQCMRKGMTVDKASTELSRMTVLVMEDLRQMYNYLFADSSVLVGGYDVNCSGLFLVGLLQDFENVMAECSPQILTTNEWKDYRLFLKFIEKGNTIRSELPLGFERISKISRFLIDNLKKNEKCGNVKFYIQVIRNNVGLAKWIVNRIEYDNRKQAEFYALRDVQMADNLRWWFANYLNERKIIIRTSSYHAARNIESRRGVRTMIDLVADDFEDQIYSIAFICWSGEYGFGGRQPVERRSRNSLEAYLHNVGMKYAFVDFNRTVLSSGKKKFRMCPTIMFKNKYEWQYVYDGVFFIDEMEPLKESEVDPDTYFIKEDFRCN